MSSTRSSPAAAGFFGVLLLLALFLAAIWYGRVMHEAYVESAQWEEVQATIVSSELVPASCGKGRDKFRVEVRYRYAVRGVPYAGDRIWFGEPFCGVWSEARAVGAQWVGGATVSAWADPAHPDRAVLVRNAVAPQTWRSLVLILIGVGCLVAGGLWVLMRKPPGRAPARPKPGGGF